MAGDSGVSRRPSDRVAGGSLSFLSFFFFFQTAVSIAAATRHMKEKRRPSVLPSFFRHGQEHRSLHVDEGGDFGSFIFLFHFKAREAGINKTKEGEP